VSYLIRALYLPLFLIVGNGSAIYLVAQGYHKLWLIALVITFILISFICERLIPVNGKFNENHKDSKRDFCHSVVNESISLTGLACIPLLIAVLPQFSLWPTSLPLWLQLFIAVMIADAGITVAHYASHRIGFLWKLHAVHHSPKRVYGFNGLTKHPLHQIFETSAGTALLVLLGIPHQVLILLVIAVLLQLLIQHSNVAYFVGPLRGFLMSNKMHHFHHLSDPKAADCNYGVFTTVADRLMGTYYYDKSRTISGAEMGVTLKGGGEYPISYIKQLVEPFKSDDLENLKQADSATTTTVNPSLER
jgi:sterol desaturase/sphingolipid hydroxylase (fatty acid hydroxylase superfamily)